MRFLCYFLCFFCFPALAQNPDLDLLQKINGSYTPTGGKVMQFASESVTPVALGVPTGMFVYGLIQKDKETRWKSAEILGVQLVNGIVTTGLKWSIHRERPFNAYPNEITKYGSGGSYSFPSGHTSTAFAFATSMSLNYPKWYVIAPCYAYACTVGYSRMYLGVHYPSDVLAGALVGSACAVGTHYLMKWVRRKWGRNEQVIP
jgi:membrane-associated phospholipid phosphatase